MPTPARSKVPGTRNTAASSKPIGAQLPTQLRWHFQEGQLSAQRQWQRQGQRLGGLTRETCEQSP